MNINPLKFQRDAVDKITQTYLSLWKKEGRQLPLVFKAPTGSGKTYITALFVRGLNHLPQWSELDTAQASIESNQGVINVGVQKASKLIPHNTDL